jgi:hypothetical protein
MSPIPLEEIEEIEEIVAVLHFFRLGRRQSDWKGAREVCV